MKWNDTKRSKVKTYMRQIQINKARFTVLTSETVKVSTKVVVLGKRWLFCTLENVGDHEEITDASSHQIPLCQRNSLMNVHGRGSLAVWDPIPALMLTIPLPYFFIYKMWLLLVITHRGLSWGWNKTVPAYTHVQFSELLLH